MDMGYCRLGFLSPGYPWRGWRTPLRVDPAKTPSLTALLLASVCVGAVAAALWLTTRLSARLPWGDDWLVAVPVLTGRQRVTWEWLWSQLNEHRIPLPRLAYLAAYACSRDFRCGGFLNVLLLALVAVSGLRVARRLRGSCSPSDVFIPLILLHWGQATVFWWSSTLNLVFPMALFYLVLFQLLESAEPFRLRRGLVCILCIAAMPLCGLTGVILAVPLAIWLLGVALWYLRPRLDCRWRGLFFLVMAGGVAGIIAFYFVGYFPCGSFAGNASGAPGDLLGRLENLGIILAMSLGWVGKLSWPVASVSLFAASCGVGGYLGLVAWRHPEMGWRAAVLMTFLLAALALVGAVAWGRTFLSGDALWGANRYALFPIPLCVCIYFAGILSPWKDVACPLWALLAVVVFLGPIVQTKRYLYALPMAREVRTQQEMFIGAAVIGEVPEQLALNFGVRSVPGAVSLVQMLQGARLGPFGLSEEDRRRYVRNDRSTPAGECRP
jgi:hypothetical protein